MEWRVCCFEYLKQWRHWLLSSSHRNCCRLVRNSQATENGQALLTGNSRCSSRCSGASWNKFQSQFNKRSAYVSGSERLWHTFVLVKVFPLVTGWLCAEGQCTRQEYSSNWRAKFWFNTSDDSNIPLSITFRTAWRTKCDKKVENVKIGFGKAQLKLRPKHGGLKKQGNNSKFQATRVFKQDWGAFFWTSLVYPPVYFLKVLEQDVNGNCSWD